MNHNLIWVDSHCHLDMLKEDVAGALRKSHENGMAFCITVGVSPQNNHHVNQDCQTYDQVYGTLGIHPHNARDFKEAHLDWIRETVQINPKIIAVGECGFDFHYGYSAEGDQKKAFVAQLELAVELNMPVVIHTRKAEALTVDVLNSFKGKGLTGVMHSFTSSLELAKYALDAGFYLSFNGISTFPKSEEVRRVMKYAPVDQILLETDSPYLTPVPHRGKPNIPGHVCHVGDFAAKFLDIPEDRFARQIMENTLRLFPKITWQC